MHKLDPKFAEDNDEMNKEMEAMILHLKSVIFLSALLNKDYTLIPLSNNRAASRNDIPRSRLTQDGIMVKGPGPQASYNVAYTAEVIDPVSIFFLS